KPLERLRLELPAIAELRNISAGYVHHSELALLCASRAVNECNPATVWRPREGALGAHDLDTSRGCVRARDIQDEDIAVVPRLRLTRRVVGQHGQRIILCLHYRVRPQL